MGTTAAEWPWQNSSDFVACNLALGHLWRNTLHRLTIDGRIHAETYISAVGAIAGYATQRTLFAQIAQSPPGTDVNLHRARMKSGEEYWFGDPLNYMLMPKTDAEANRCVWSLAAGGAMSAGIQAVPSLEAMFKHVVSTLGEANEGRSSVPAQHQAHLPARDLLKAVWPTAVMCFTANFPDVKPGGYQVPAAPVEWWSAIAAWASNGSIERVKDVLSADIALTLLMESAIYYSKLDKSKVEGT
jgi:hypothetical protein